MKALAKSSFIFIAMSSAAFAAGGGHGEPSIKDLIYPTVNFVILAAGAVWLLKKPMKDMFDKNAEEIVSKIESAEKQNKDAQEKLKTLEAQMANLQNDIAQIKKDYTQDVELFGKNSSEETQNTIARTKRDLASKLEGEKKQVTETINEELLDKVIAKTQETIRANADMKNRATSKIISELR